MRKKLNEAKKYKIRFYLYYVCLNLFVHFPKSYISSLAVFCVVSEYYFSVLKYNVENLSKFSMHMYIQIIYTIK